MNTTSIPASQIVNVTPNVLSAGGSALNVIGLVLTQNARVPINDVQPFADEQDVANYFGPASHEANIAAVYFGGFNGASVTPESLLFAQYNATNVAAYLRGGNVSALTLGQLQALSGTLSVTMDGYVHNAGSVSLSAASSFSAAAGIMQTALDASEPTEASFTGTIGATFTGSGSGTALTITDVTGLISVGDGVAGTGVPSNTQIIAQVSGPAGGAGLYTTNNSTTASDASLTSSSNVLVVSAIVSGALAIGQVLVGVGVTVGTTIVGLGTGTGQNGTYTLSGAQQVIASESMTTTATAVTVTFDSTSGAFVITSGITGTPSTAAFATGTLAVDLLLTGAGGAVLSQGAVAATPGGFMDNIVELTQNWVTFMTAFDPDNGSGNANKLLFAQWVSRQNDQYAYVCWDTDASPTTQVPASSSLGQLLKAGDYSGTFLIYEPSDLLHAPFVCGVAASINFSETNGRITFKFRQQDGLVPGVTNASVAANLAANGYNYYGGYATRNENFQFLANGVVSGEFDWFDSFINQIWLNSELQLAILTGLTNVKSVPYNAAGYALIEAFCLDPINAALNFGAIRPGVPLSAAQVAEVNQAAGVAIAPTLQTRGWYLQVQPASAEVRASRGSPPCTLWYMDGGAVQQIDLDSIEVQ